MTRSGSRIARYHRARLSAPFKRIADLASPLEQPNMPKKRNPVSFWLPRIHSFRQLLSCSLPKKSTFNSTVEERYTRNPHLRQRKQVVVAAQLIWCMPKDRACLSPLSKHLRSFRINSFSASPESTVALWHGCALDDLNTCRFSMFAGTAREKLWMVGYALMTRP